MKKENEAYCLAEEQADECRWNLYLFYELYFKLQTLILLENRGKARSFVYYEHII